MTDLLVTFTNPTRNAVGELYYARAFGQNSKDGRWRCCIEFAHAGSKSVARTGAETVQSTRDDLEYWAQGLSPTYLEGALVRALSPAIPSALV